MFPQDNMKYWKVTTSSIELSLHTETFCLLYYLTLSSFFHSGGEVKDCVRSSDCGPGMCCARHFWSKICKPVLTEGQVCTHRRKNTHTVEIFQRCDCSQGLICRVQKERATVAESQQQLLLQQQQPGKNNTSKAARKLHTCQSG